MPRDPLSSFSTTTTPQNRPVPGRTDQVKNNAGGYVFSKTDWEKLEDFLVLGTVSGSYYVGQDKLTADNVEFLINLAKTKSTEIAERATELSAAIPARVPSPRACLFALAAVSAFGDPAGVQAVKRLLPQAARTTDHLAMFFGYRKQFKSKVTARGTSPVTSRAYRSTLASWFLEADANDVAFRACKARQRKTPAGEAFDLTDAVRLAHPKARNTGFLDENIVKRNVLFGWLAGNITDENAALALPAVDKFLRAKAVTTPAEAIRAVTELRVPWEFLPSSVLADKGVWEALVHTVGITALIRNLARMTRIGTISPLSATTSAVIKRLTNQEALTKGRVHPMTVYLALKVYASGTSQPNPKADRQTWTPVTDISDALEEAYELSFGHLVPSGKKMLIAVDSSGSMSYHTQVTLNGSDLGLPYQVASAIALTLKRIEGENAHVIDVDTSVHQSPITKRTRLGEVQKSGPSGGGTNLSLPFEYARAAGLEVDGFFIGTDNETWHGGSHPFQSLAAYRRQFNSAAKVAVASYVPNHYSIMEQNDPGVINMAGLDASLPLAVTGFFRGWND
jgi:60 kDa SS-A/Ro ribonucleoprotein